MKIKKLHKWDISYEQAKQIQQELSACVKFTPLKKQPKTVAAIDCAFSKDKKRICAAVVVFSIPELVELQTVTAVRILTFPYIPGLLSFREAPVCLDAVGKLNITPDIFLIDGQGIAHPRRLGLASHLGLFLDVPTIGCAKSRLTGTFNTPGRKKGDYQLLKDRSQPIGAVLRTRDNVKPVYVSVGNKCSLQDAINITLLCTTRYRLPEPARAAHKKVTLLRTAV